MVAVLIFTARGLGIAEAPVSQKVPEQRSTVAWSAMLRYTDMRRDYNGLLLSIKLHSTLLGSRNSSTVAILGSRGRASVSLGARRPTTAGRCLADPCLDRLPPNAYGPEGGVPASRRERVPAA